MDLAAWTLCDVRLSCPEGGSSSSCPGKQVFADLIEANCVQVTSWSLQSGPSALQVTLVERSRFGQLGPLVLRRAVPELFFSLKF